MIKVENNGVNIDYDIAGLGDTTLLLVHGAFINQTYWDEQIQYFTATHQVVTMDLAGHGDSGRNRDTWTIREFGNDVIALIRDLNLENVILVGHSMGGDVCLEVAVAHPAPIIGLIGIDTFKNAGMPLAPEFRDQVTTILHDLQTNFEETNEQYVRRVLVTPATNRDVTERVVMDYRYAYKPMALPMMTDVFEYGAREKELLSKLRIPLYLINVNYMPTNEQALKQNAPAGYELINMEGTSHFPMIENPQRFDALLEQTVAKVERKTANV